MSIYGIQSEDGITKITTDTPANLTISGAGEGPTVNLGVSGGGGGVTEVTSANANLVVTSGTGPVVGLEVEDQVPAGAATGEILGWDNSASEWQIQSADIHIGTNSGASTGSVNIGEDAGGGTTGSTRCISLGTGPAASNTGSYVISLGHRVNEANAGDHVVSISEEAGRDDAGYESINIGLLAGASSAGHNSINLGTSSGENACGDESISIGAQSAYQGAGLRSVNLGSNCSTAGSGASSVNLGYNACQGHAGGTAPVGSFNIALGSIRAEAIVAPPAAARKDVLLDVSTGELFYGSTTGPTIPSGTKAQMLAFPSPSTGQQFYVVDAGQPENNKLAIYSGRTWQVSGETFEMKCDGNMDEGYAVQISSAGPYEVELTTTQQDRDVCGVVAWEDRSNNDYTAVAIHGIWPVAVKSNTYDEDEYIRTSSNAGIGEETSQRKGVYAKVVKAATVASNGDLLQCFLHHVEMD